MRFTLATGFEGGKHTGLQWLQIDMQRRCAWINADQAKGKKAIADKIVVIAINSKSLSRDSQNR